MKEGLVICSKSGHNVLMVLQHCQFMKINNGRHDTKFLERLKMIYRKL